MCSCVEHTISAQASWESHQIYCARANLESFVYLVMLQHTAFEKAERCGVVHALLFTHLLIRSLIYVLLYDDDDGCGHVLYVISHNHHWFFFTYRILDGNNSVYFRSRIALPLISTPLLGFKSCMQQESHVYDAPFQVLQMPSWSISSLFHIQTIPNNNDKNRAITSYRAIHIP